MTNVGRKRKFLWFVLPLFLCGCSWFTWLPGVEERDKKDKKEKLEPAELVNFEPEVTLKRLWRTSIGEGLGKKYLKLSPVVVADQILACDGYGMVVSVDRFTVKRNWRTQFDQLDRGFFSFLNFIDRDDPSFVSGGLGSGAGMVLLGTTRGEVVALSLADGSLAWRSQLDTEILSTPAYSDGKIFVQSVNDRIAALDEKTGELIWAYDNQTPILTLRGTSSPTVQNGLVVAGISNGKVIALRADSGEPVWEHRVMLPEGRSELDRIVDVDADPLSLGASIYASSYQGRLKRLSIRDGRPRWEYKSSSFQDLAEGYGQIYLVDQDDSVHAVDQNTGESIWIQESFARRQLSSPSAFSNYVAIGDFDGYLHVIAQRDGRLMGRRKIDRSGIRSNMVVSEGVLYILTNSGSLQAIQVNLR